MYAFYCYSILILNKTTWLSTFLDYLKNTFWECSVLQGAKVIILPSIIGRNKQNNININFSYEMAVSKNGKVSFDLFNKWFGLCLRHLSTRQLRWISEPRFLSLSIVFLIDRDCPQSCKLVILFLKAPLLSTHWPNLDGGGGCGSSSFNQADRGTLCRFSYSKEENLCLFGAETGM